ncbi:HlyD family efflux transporter periplasmic adaptor subunit [Lactobacillus kalixensis]|uniref:Accessory protein n=1 Tax=Lactobacillus kalixensis DSM 16043 TaxID=1423763 RepID=A0A0R1UD72_9LACO|nr:HlyD family efflux transporter periplasmic adaptor subunit [Lactobacillus kalixensis]KRL88872.1 accessory protein [Lactobacillus kalixensis DSM 16043]
MDKTKDYESSEFYSYKFKNFSTMIIVPAAILVVLLIISSFFAVRQNTVTAEGSIEPARVVNVNSSKYQEGQTITRNKQKWTVHLDEKDENLVHLMTKLNPKKIRIMVYLPGNKISAIKKGQTIHMSLANSNGTTDRLTGKVTTVASYPINVRGTRAYEVLCEAKAKNKNLKYGMTGEVSIITGKSTYFEYLKDKVLDK